MNLKNIISLLCFFVICLVCSCDTEGTPEVTQSLTTISAKMEYMINEDARYRVEFGNIVLADSLPRLLDAGQGLTSPLSLPAYINTQELTRELKVWRLGANGEQTLELNTQVTGKENGIISLLQLSEDMPVSYFQPVYPPNDKISQTMAQFVFSETEQPQEVNVSILAVDYYSLLMASNNINNVSSSRKEVVAEFNLSKGIVSIPVTLDLNIFEGVNNNLPAQFFYRITDVQTGTILQDYNVNNKITVQTQSGLQLNPEYKFTLFQWEYQSLAIPFKKPIALINGEEWID